MSTRSIHWRMLLPLVPLLALVAIVLMCLCAPWFTAYDPLHSVNGDELKPPTSDHLLGTDWAGRDVLSRTLYGGRSTLAVAALSLALAVIPGAIVGLLAGWTGGLLDRVISAGLDALLAIPSLLVALAIITLIRAGPLAVAVAVGVAGFAPFARYTRTATISARAMPYVEAARAIGATPLRMLRWHILPNILPSLIAFGAVTLSWAIASAATLNFLGFGGDPSMPEWGAMLAEARQTFRLAPWATLAPGAAIMITLLAVNLLADGLSRRD